MKSRIRLTQALWVACASFALSSAWADTGQTSIAGKVVGSNGAPVAHAVIHLTTALGADAGSATTDAAGHFEFAHMPPGTYAVVADASGFAPTTQMASTTTGQSAQVILTLAQDNTLNIQVNAKRLNEARNGLLPETGSSVYRISRDDIQTMPQGENTPLNQVLLQAPGVVDDSYGQIHVRGDHADLQYRINDILIPEPISGFGQSFDTHIIDQVNLLTGALPAEYGYRTAGIVDIHTKSGDLGDGGSVSVYGGSHQTLQTSADAYGSQGNFSYFLSGSLGENNLGIEAPTSSADPLHDHTRQGDGFGYLSYMINPLTRASLMFGTSANHFQIPNTPGLAPNYSLAGVPSFDSAYLNETQSELNNFVVFALQGTDGSNFDYLLSLFNRYSRTQFNPDPIGDLIFNGVASQDFHSDTANGLQLDTTYRLNGNHTLRIGTFFQQESAKFSDNVSVFPVDDGNQTSDEPFTLSDANSKTGYLYSGYVQDEWKFNDLLTLNYGLRYDGMNEYVQANQLSPRLGAIYKLTSTTTLHAGYARYFTPPSMELVSSTTISQYTGTTNQSMVTQNDPVQPERDDYFDVGVTQRINPDLTMGLDTYYKKAHNLLDEGQFGAALIYTPFNYQYGRVFGTEFTTNYKHDNVSAYLNLAYSNAQGKDVTSAQFNFAPDELAYISNHWVQLDHDQRITASLGGSYAYKQTTFTTDVTVGSGLREGFANTGELPAYTQVNMGVIQHFNTSAIGKADLRLTLVNAFGRTYELRDGSGIGVFAPQYGPYRAIYAGLTKYF